MTTTPAAGAILTNAGTRTTGGMENIGTAPTSNPSYGGGTGLGVLGGTLYVSTQVITSVIVKVSLVAVPIFSIPPVVLVPALVKIAPAAGVVVITCDACNLAKGIS
jgi:hypothetical protein